MVRFASSDLGALTFGREILRQNLRVGMEFLVGLEPPSVPPLEKGGGTALREMDFWEVGLRQILNGRTRFGRVGVVYDRTNGAAQQFCALLSGRDALPGRLYRPRDVRRAEKEPRISTFEVQVLRHMANEGLADSVEFRRLGRKYLRRAKHAHCDTLFFLDAIMGEEKTKKILQHLAGTQMRVVTVDEFVESKEVLKQGSDGEKEERRKKKEGGARVVIHTGEDVGFTKQRAEKILRTKLAEGAVLAV